MTLVMSGPMLMRPFSPLGLSTIVLLPESDRFAGEKSQGNDNRTNDDLAPMRCGNEFCKRKGDYKHSSPYCF